MVAPVLPLLSGTKWLQQPATCRECPLYGIGKGFVPAEVGRQVRLLIQGEAPGKQEIQQKQPFCGPAGWWLERNILNQIGVTRDEVALDNTLRCLPPANKQGEYYPVGEVRAAAEVHCRQYDIWHTFPRAIPLLLVGGKALQQVLGHQRLSDWHGHIERGADGRLVGCTFHPAAVMRQHNLLPVVVREAYNLLLAAANPTLLQHPLVVRELPSARPSAPMVFDLEWNKKEEVTCVGVAYEAGQAFSSYSVDTGVTLVKSHRGTLVGHNIIDADFRVLNFVPDSFSPACVFDTKIAAHLAHPHLANLGLLDLGSLVRYYRPTTNWKLDTRDLLEYNGRDCAYNYYLYEQLLSELTSSGQLHLLEKQQQLAYMARLMHERGIRINHAAVVEHHQQWQEGKLEMAQRFPFNPNSPKQVLAWFKAAGIPLKDTRETTIQRAAGRHAILQELADYKQLGVKPITTWFPLDNDYVYPRWNVTGTDVARFSCSDPNFQNIPPALRPMIVPRQDGWVLVSFDFSQIENRCIAWLAGDQQMLADFAAGQDFHRLSASRIYQKAIEEVTDDERYEGKRTIHATNYCETAAHLAERLFGNRKGASVTRARWLQDAYFRAYPAIRAWQEGIAARLDSGDLQLRNPFGRQRSIYAASSHERQKRGCHYLGCSTAADIVNQRALDVWHELGLLPLLIVHDELVYEMSTQDSINLIPQIRSVLERPVGELGGLVVPVKAKVGGAYGQWE